MNVNDMLDYFEIKLDSKDKKRVSELSVLREEAVDKKNVSKVANIDDELNKVWLGLSLSVIFVVKFLYMTNNNN